MVQELLKEEKTIAQIAAEYEVHPTQLRRWKAVVVEGMPSLFDEKDSLGTLRTEYEERLNELYGDIGRLTTHLPIAQFGWGTPVINAPSISCRVTQAQ